MKKPIIFFSLVFLVFITWACNKNKNKAQATSNNSPQMINIKNSPYMQVWKTIDSLERRGLPKSALEKVQAHYTHVQNENETAQIIKCLIYLGKYQSQLEEDGFVKTINEMRQHIDKANFPQNKILESMLAELYSRYLDQNYWKLRDRTELDDFQPDDMQTWTIGQLTNAANGFYVSSINDDRTQKIELSKFDAILSDSRHAEGLQPTLFDFLVNRAINYFSNDRTYLTTPAYKFYINQPELLGGADEFINYRFDTKDSTANKLHVLKLYQSLLSFHNTSDYKEAFVYNNLKRLKFVHNNSVIPNKSKLYLSALEQMRGAFEGNAIQAEVDYYLAEFYFNENQNFVQGESEEKQFAWKKALDICNRAIEKYPDSYGASECKTIKQSIIVSHLSLQSEMINLPDQPLLIRVEYRNVEKVAGRIIKITEKQKQKIDKTEWDKRSDEIKKLDPLRGFGFDLPQVGDYRAHSVEYNLGALPLGLYLVAISNDKVMDKQNHSFQYVYLHVSDIAYANRNNNEGDVELVLTSRTTGEPLSGVEVSFYKQNYNNLLRKYEQKLIKKTKSDTNGFARYGGSTRERFSFKFKKGEDQLDINSSAYRYAYSGKRKNRQQIYYFLDRAIYRPGQPVYFKGLAISYDEKGMPSIITNEEVTVVLKDVNHQDVEKLELRTNEYGTFNGVFTAPNNGITGQMHIVSEWSGRKDRKYFRVEEYKRPKFEVKFEPVKGSFKLNETVSVSGQAKAYAGSNIDGAQVVYRVIREARFPYYPWWRWGGFYRPNSPSMEIENGTTKTDATGEFEIDFTALDDPSIDPTTKPVFYYTVYADVIDITGETHSSTTLVKVGTIALQASFDIPAKANSDSLNSIKLSTKNLNGEFEAASGTLKIEKLKTPENAFINRFWSLPDQQIIQKDDFKKAFPNYAFQNEDKEQNWPVESITYSTDWNTSNTDLIALQQKLAPGKYAVTLNTKDAFGASIEVKRFVTIYDLDVAKVPSNEILFDVLEQGTAQPGDEVDWYFGSIHPQQKMLLEIEFDRNLIRQEWLTVNGLEKVMQEIVEAHRGGIFLNLYMVKDNRAKKIAHTINVPWKNKELNFEYSTFRDKLYPGQDETWQIKISGNKKDKVMAEMLAGMYDASLDAFAPNNWGLSLYPNNTRLYNWQLQGYSARTGQELHYGWENYGLPSGGNKNRYLEQLNWFGFNNYAKMIEEMTMMSDAVFDTVVTFDPETYEEGVQVVGRRNMKKLESTTAGLSANDAAPVAAPAPSAEPENEDKRQELTDTGDVDEGGSAPQIRTNLKETVFFFPNLKTDAEGNVVIEFTMNEALTRWKFMGLAHSKDLKFGKTTKEVVTQKDLMVLPNPPRFFREGDLIEYTAKVSNLTEKDMTGSATLQLFDAITMEPLDVQLGNRNHTVSFSAKAGQSDRLAWKLNIPVGQLGAVVHRVVAKAGNFSDGEESALPILTNRMLVTETLPLPVRGNQTKAFNFKAMDKSDKSNTLTHHKMTLEFTSNPAWYAVQALPYMMEYPYECTEQVFSRYYANALATNVANSHPKVKRIFEAWKGTDALESNLMKNQELKSALIEETPWVLQAQSEAQQKRNIGLLFDLNRMARESQKAMTTIVDRQLSNGGFSWFPGGRDNWYITQYLVEGMGHLNELGVEDFKSDEKMKRVLKRAISYTDDRIAEQYDRLKKRIKRYGGDINDDHLNNMAIHYLYARSFFTDQDISPGAQEAFDYYLGQAEKYWLNKGMYSEGMIALAVNRFKNSSSVPGDIVKSLKERSLNHDELGMYWKYNTGYYWYQAPIETHALMIEVFDEVAQDAQTVDDLKVWLLKNKQTNHWKTTKATSAAVYAMLRRGDNWLLEDQPVKITLGNQVIDQSKLQTEAGTGYFKTSWDGDEIKANMKEVKVENPNSVVAWGAMYWQYFEQLDKIETFEDTPLKINKKLFKESNSDRGPVLNLVDENMDLDPGDKLKVRIELRVDRDMEYVHMKDMRASGFEPINVLSSYKWQGGLGYYESTRDASTNFFFSYLPKGTYVFEYPLRVIHNGDFSNGVTTVQCMYAPEFTSHSEGIRVKVE